MLITPGGNPTSCTICARANTASGLGSGTFTTTVQPAMIAGATFCEVPGMEKL